LTEVYLYFGRLFVTGLASTVDDVRLYLAFQNCGKILEAHVAKPGDENAM
jgi:hypothetical protein